MKKINYNFSPSFFIFIILLFLNLIVVFINKNELNIWGYFILAGIFPILIVSFANAIIFEKNNIRDIILLLIFITILESIILTFVSNSLDLQQIVDNTKMKGSDFSMTASVDHDIVGDFMTTWIPSMGISVILVSILSKISRKRYGH